MVTLEELQQQVDDRLRNGQPFSRIELDLIEPSDLTEDEKSALWLYGWAHLGDGPLRYQWRLQRAREQTAGPTIIRH
jgi:hypothetical protein